jgi:hypothetical protein
MACHSVFAAMPSVKYSEGENVEFFWDNLSKINTLSPGHISFGVRFNSASRSSAEYTVKYSVDDGYTIVQSFLVPASKVVEKHFSLYEEAGIHNFSISIEKAGNILYNNEEKLYVIKNYEHQFMDELSGRGVNAHIRLMPYIRDLKYCADLIGMAGWKVVRGSDDYEYAEKERNVYNFSYSDNVEKYYRPYGIRTYYLTGYGNGWLYIPERDMDKNVGWSTHTKNMGPQTEESILQYAAFHNEVAKHYKDSGNLEAIETWNEYNHRSWLPDTTAQSFTDFIKPIKLQLIKNGNDEADISTFTFHTNNKQAWYEKSMEIGFYPYFDRIAEHRYSHKGNFEASNALEAYCVQSNDTLTNFGGWKITDVSECGFTTPEGANSYATEESAAQEIAKMYTIFEYNDFKNIMVYDLMNDGQESTYTEHNFGQVNYDGTLKPQYLTLTNYNNQTSGAVLIGEIKDSQFENGTRAFLYYKDGKPVVITWANLSDSKEQTWNLGNENVQVIDNLGNAILNNAQSVTYGKDPIYIKGLSEKWILNAVYNDLCIKNDNFLSKYSEKLPDGIVVDAKKIFSNAEKHLTEDISNEDVFKLFEEYMQFGIDIIKVSKENGVNETDISGALWLLYKGAEKLNNLYITKCGNNPLTEIGNNYEKSYLKSREYLDKMMIKQHSDAILRFARNYYNAANTVYKLEENPSKNGVINAYSAMSEELCRWFDTFYEVESLTNIGLQIQTPYYDRKTYVNREITTEVNLNNYGNEDFNGTICVYNEQGEKVAETSPVKVKANGGYKQTSVTIKADKPKDDSGISYYYFVYVDNEGNHLASLRNAYEVKDSINASVLPCEMDIKNLKNIQLRVENLLDVEQNAHIALESDNGLKFKSSGVDVKLAAKESKVIDIPLAYINDVKYHLYSFEYKITDDSGYVVAQQDSLISFTNIIKTENDIDIMNWDGNISEWEDAYPFYINIPKKATEFESWKNAECSARAFLKYNSNALYALVDVYDEAFLQTFAGSSMWQGDSLQISIDALNDKATAYQDDDYELGFSYTYVGNEFYAWKSPSTLKTGDVDFFKMIRDDNNNFTRYLIKLDKTILTNVSLGGKPIGLNLAINDNDYLSREGFYQFTKGTADSKNPSLYKNFKFFEEKSGILEDGFAGEIFPLSVQDNIASKKSLTDIKGHWAEKNILEMVQFGYLSGVGNNLFEPDRDMTRAEFITMVVQSMEMQEDSNRRFTDVVEGEWYEGYINSASGIIPDAMIDDDGNLRPEIPITRQEAFYILTKAYLNDENEEINSMHIQYYNDGEDVSLWAIDMLNIAIDRRIITGTPEGNLNPNNNITRAEAATCVLNALKLK